MLLTSVVFAVAISSLHLAGAEFGSLFLDNEEDQEFSSRKIVEPLPCGHFDLYINKFSGGCRMSYLTSLFKRNWKGIITGKELMKRISKTCRYDILYFIWVSMILLVFRIWHKTVCVSKRYYAISTENRLFLPLTFLGHGLNNLVDRANSQDIFSYCQNIIQIERVNPISLKMLVRLKSPMSKQIFLS